MSDYKTELIGYAEQESDPIRRVTAKTLGSILVRPPISIGPGYKDAVLGKEKNGVDIIEVSGTVDATVLLAMSSRGSTPEERAVAITTIEERIGQLANKPETVMELLAGNPFPVGMKG